MDSLREVVQLWLLGISCMTIKDRTALRIISKCRVCIAEVLVYKRQSSSWYKHLDVTFRICSTRIAAYISLQILFSGMINGRVVLKGKLSSHRPQHFAATCRQYALLLFGKLAASEGGARVCILPIFTELVLVNQQRSWFGQGSELSMPT